MEDGKVMIKIIYEDNHLLVVEKPINILVQADNTNDIDLLTMLKEDLKKRYNKTGNVYLGLVHRLDRPVGGIMVFAKTSKCASRLSEQIRTNLFKKVYYAVVCGNIQQSGELIDKLYKDEKINVVYVSEKGKLSKLHYKKIASKDNLSLIKIWLETGRSHQIRVQFASRNYPLFGDQKYNKNSKRGEQIALFAKELTLFHPITKEELTFKTNLPTTYPWNLFL